ncbi:MAG: hypothetical protein IJZ42_13395 [Lachnospiraceae bacterium]|nr:hypothetical protein [Lachnospiraceae bacterium]
MDKEYLKFILAFDYGDKLSRKLDLTLDEFYEVAGRVADRYKEDCTKTGKSEYYESFCTFVENTSFVDVWQKMAEEKRESSKVTLSDFLEMFDFSYRLYLNDNPHEQALRHRLIEEGELNEEDIDKPLIGLIDTQGANLGNIEGDRFFLNKNLVEAIIERMDIYVNDYVIKEFEEALRDREMDPSQYNLQEMFLLCKGLEVGEGEVSYTMAELVLTPDAIFVPEIYSALIKDIEQEQTRGDTQPFVITREDVKPLAIALLNSEYYDGSSSEKSILLDIVQEDIYEENIGILIDIFEKNGYCIDTQQDNIVQLNAIFDKQHNDLEFFDVVAPYVEKGTELRLFDENGSPMRLSFDGQACHCCPIKPRLSEKISDAEKSADKANNELGTIDRFPREEVK